MSVRYTAMREVLDYATPTAVRSPSRWPYITVAVVGAVLAVVMLGVHCVSGILRVSAESRFDREDAWLRMLLTTPWCMAVIAGAWWAAKKVQWKVHWFRRAFWLSTAFYFLTLIGMAARLAI